MKVEGSKTGARSETNGLASRNWFCFSLRGGSTPTLVLALVLTGCGGDEDNEDEAGLPNPASVFCEEQGGTVEIRDESSGQVGFCVFPDGNACEEWAFYRGECSLPGDN